MYVIGGVLYLDGSSFARLIGRHPSRVGQLRSDGRFDGWSIKYRGRWFYRLDAALVFAREYGG